MILTKLVYSIIIGENDIVFKKNVDYSKNGLKILCFNDLENYKGGDAGIEKREKSWTDSEYAVYSLFLTVTPIVLILIIGSLLGKTIQGRVKSNMA